LKTLTAKQILYSLVSLWIFSNSYSQESNKLIEKKIDKIIKGMSIDQKIGQACLKGTSSRRKGLSEELKNEVRKGFAGSVLNLTEPFIANN
jgi:beta-glucosidase